MEVLRFFIVIEKYDFGLGECQKTPSQKKWRTADGKVKKLIFAAISLFFVVQT